MDSQRELLQQLVDDPSVHFSKADAEALAGVDIVCLLKCAGAFGVCMAGGGSIEECGLKLAQCVAGCL